MDRQLYWRAVSADTEGLYHPISTTTQSMTYRFFVVDDDRHYARLLSYRLDKDAEHEVHVYHSGEEALDALDAGTEPDLILLDIMMPGIGGMETLRRIRLLRPEMPVVMISAQGTIDVAIEAMKGGANDYITKGQDDLVKLDAVVKNHRERIKLAREVESLRGEVAGKYGLDEIVGDSPAMEEVYRLIHKTLRGNLTVAIQGESGTGKELVARAIHFNSAHVPDIDGPGPFVVVNCAAIPSELMESEFFGHEKGSFTGAHARKIGKFEQADGGTIFLDEIGELNLGLQAKLLRAIQNREITRVGGNDTITFECRVISATNKDILKMVADGSFREDLYYRLFQFPILLPPLRDRDKDVLVLAHEFLNKYTEDRSEFAGKRFSAETTRAIAVYAWPGNVRELKNAVERAVLISDSDVIEVADLMLDGPQAVAPWNERVRKDADSIQTQPDMGGDGIGPVGTAVTEPTMIVSSAAQSAQVGTDSSVLGEGDTIVPLEDLKQQAVVRAYELCDGSVDRASVELGIGRATMYRLLKKYEISTE
ncbi:MAG: sigma-54-dependent Fis family transcriptional regulator [Bacteroidetes bacterium]|nr:sigma-54-dependent Fis family transcriptional regulator [Bacteroidota bacterium]